MVSMHDSLPKSVVLVLLYTVILGETLEYDINFLQQGVNWVLQQGVNWVLENYIKETYRGGSLLRGRGIGLRWTSIQS